MNRNRFSRREFIGLGAAAGAALGLKTIVLDPDPLWALPQTMAASDRVRFGMIGIGMQGSGLLSTAIELPGVQCAAACDLYDGRHTLAKEIVRPDLPTTRRYHELLENKDIDCIVAAVPDHWHKQVVVDAVSAGKDIYIEKPMSHTAEEGVEMVAAAKKANRIVQVGSQRVSSVICAKARELVAQGALGDLMLVEGSLGRNDPTGAWEYPPPTDLSLVSEKEFSVSAVNKAMAACSGRNFGTRRPTIHNASVKTPKRMRSTIGEIQMIGSETCSVGPQRAQLILWKSNRPTPSTRPAMSANQMARSRRDPRPGGDPALGDGTSVVVSVRDTQPSLRLIGAGTIGNGRRGL